MRRALVILVVVGCGAKAPPPQGSISNTAPQTANPPSQELPLQGGGGGDRDGDGVADAMDRCPDDPEDYDGFSDEDGCPEPDNDADGVLDVDDLCPNNAEDRDGDQDDDGCPE